MPKGVSSPCGRGDQDDGADCGADFVGQVVAEDDGRHGGPARRGRWLGRRGMVWLVLLAGAAGEIARRDCRRGRRRYG